MEGRGFMVAYELVWQPTDNTSPMSEGIHTITGTAQVDVEESGSIDENS